MSEDEKREEVKEEILDDVEKTEDNTQDVKTEENQEVKKDDGKKKKSKKGPLIIIIILLLIAIFACVYFLVLPKTVKTETKKEVKKSQYRLSGNGLENFDLYFLQLENKEMNKVYSPLSIKYALAMLQDGANGETKEQITNLIGDYKPKAYTNSDHMSFANAMFIRNTFKDKVKTEYVTKLQKKYNAEVILDEFAGPDNINNWVSNKTFKLINNLVDSVEDNDFFLINALAIDMNWNNQIHCASGSEVPCLTPKGYHVYYDHEKISDNDEYAYSDVSYPYTSDNSFPSIDFNGDKKVKSSEILVDVNRYNAVKEIGEDKIRKEVGDAYRKWLESEETKSAMQWDKSIETDVNKYLNTYIKELDSNYKKESYSTDLSLYVDEDVKVFAKDLQTYDNVTLQYVGIMPKNEKLSDFVKNSNAEKINILIKNLKEAKIDNFKDGVATIVRGNIPFFKYEYQLELIKDLESLGVKNIFDINKSDLSGMLDGEKEAINPAIHKANIEFSNDGIKAGASTAFGGYGASRGGFEYLYKIPIEEIDLTFDKPYMYIIRDKATGEVWFTGTVYEPIVG